MPNSPLVDFFLGHVPGHYEFLVTAHAMTLAVEVIEGQWVALRYRRPDLVIEVSYGDDRDHYFGVTVARADSGESSPVAYGLSEWLQEIGGENWWVHMAGLWTEEAIDRHARRAADALRDGLPCILAAGPEVREAFDRRRAAAEAIYRLPPDQWRTD